ncbi:MAG: DUF1648 domain-containing protein [Ruminococcaceae bacterium]|nr:DUF1648 domain-containing protein [Oscillospiraceae bacterium]
MLKKYKSTIIFTSVITVLPIFAGLILWNRLPDEIATHFGTDNTPDGYSSKAFAVFGLPLIMLGIHLICLIGTNADPKRKNISDKAIGTVLWIIPIISLVLMGATYAYALGNKIKIGFIVLMLLGVLFILLGNYLPKTQQNYTFGLRIPWTLNDGENWVKTHRLSGWLMVIGGAVICATAIFENPWIFFPVVIAMLLIPVAYSYKLYKDKGNK